MSTYLLVVAAGELERVTSEVGVVRVLPVATRSTGAWHC